MISRNYICPTSHLKTAVQWFILNLACPNNPQVLMLLSLNMRDIFYLLDCYFAYHVCQCVPILLSNGRCYPMFSSPNIIIGVPVYLTLLLLNIMNMMNGLNNLVTGLVLQNMMYTL